MCHGKKRREKCIADLIRNPSSPMFVMEECASDRDAARVLPRTVMEERWSRHRICTPRYNHGSM
eukprot:gene10602-biopygen744